MNAHTKIHKLLEENQMIAHIWCLEDVEHVRPDLTKDQCWEVLQNVKYSLDAEFGVCWDTLRIHAQSLYGDFDENNP